MSNAASPIVKIIVPLKGIVFHRCALRDAVHSRLVHSFRFKSSSKSITSVHVVRNFQVRGLNAMKSDRITTNGG